MYGWEPTFESLGKPLHTWKIAVTTPLSLFNANPSISAFVWVYQAIQK